MDALGLGEVCACIRAHGVWRGLGGMDSGGMDSGGAVLPLGCRSNFGFCLHGQTTPAPAVRLKGALMGDTNRFD